MPVGYEKNNEILQSVAEGKKTKIILNCVMDKFIIYFFIKKKKKCYRRILLLMRLVAEFFFILIML